MHVSAREQNERAVAGMAKTGEAPAKLTTLGFGRCEPEARRPRSRFVCDNLNATSARAGPTLAARAMTPGAHVVPYMLPVCASCEERDGSIGSTVAR
jgi:hypothetical protein